MTNTQIILYKFIQIHNNLNWNYISDNYKLSENFIREFQDKVNWWCMLNYQNLSEKFKSEFKYKNI